MNFHRSYPFWLKTTLLEIQNLLNSAKKMQLQMGTLSSELSFIKLEHFTAYQVGMLFSGNIIMIFLSSFGDSVVSLRIAVWEAGISIRLPPGLPLWDSCAKIKPRVVQGRNFLCGPRMPHLLGEAVWAQGLPGGGCAQHLPGRMGRIQGPSGRAQCKEKRQSSDSKLFCPFLLNTVGLPTTNGDIESLTVHPLLSWWYFILQWMLLLSALLRWGYLASPKVPEMKDQQLKQLPYPHSASSWVLQPRSPAPSISWKPHQAELSVLLFVKGIRSWTLLCCLQSWQTPTWDTHTQDQGWITHLSKMWTEGTDLKGEISKKETEWSWIKAGGGAGGEKGIIFLLIQDEQSKKQWTGTARYVLQLMRSFGAVLGRIQPLLKAFRQVPDASSLPKSTLWVSSLLGRWSQNESSGSADSRHYKMLSFAVLQEALRTQAPTPSSRQHCTSGDHAHTKAEPALSG